MPCPLFELFYPRKKNIKVSSNFSICQFERLSFIMYNIYLDNKSEYVYSLLNFYVETVNRRPIKWRRKELQTWYTKGIWIQFLVDI